MKRRREQGVGGRVKKEVKPVFSRSSSMGESSKTHGLMGFVDVLGVSTGVCPGDDTISSSIAVYNIITSVGRVPGLFVSQWPFSPRGLRLWADRHAVLSPETHVSELRGLRFTGLWVPHDLLPCGYPEGDTAGDACKQTSTADGGVHWNLLSKSILSPSG